MLYSLILMYITVIRTKYKCMIFLYDLEVSKLSKTRYEFLLDMSECLLWSSDTWMTDKIGIEMLKHYKFLIFQNVPQSPQPTVMNTTLVCEYPWNCKLEKGRIARNNGCSFHRKQHIVMKEWIYTHYLRDGFDTIFNIFSFT